MKIIQNPETCPLCEYSRQGLEPGRPCPECGVGIFPNAPVLDFSVERRSVRLLILASGSTLVLAMLIGMLRVPAPVGAFDWLRLLFLLVVVGSAILIWLAYWFDRVRMYAVLSMGEVVFVRGGRIRWQMGYDAIADRTASMVEGNVILRDKTGKGRRLPARTRKDQAIIIAAIEDVLERYCDEDEVLSPTRATGFNLRDRAATVVPPQREE